MSKVTFLIGLPRSGKSTIAQRWSSEKPNRVVLTGDSFRKALTGNRYNYYAEDFVQSALYLAARALYNSGYEIMIDETHTTPKNIKRVLEIDKNATPKLVDTHIEICIERAISTKQPDLIPVIKRHHDNLMKFKHNLDDYIDELRQEIVGTNVVKD